MKTKITISIIVIVAAIFVANTFYGRKVAKDLDAQLKAKIENNELPVKISYDNLRVNPMFSKISFSNVQLNPVIKGGTINGKELELSIPYSEAQRLLENPEFEELNSFELTFSDLTFKNKKDTVLHSADELNLAFDGHITRADIEMIHEKFPVNDQHVHFSFENLSLGIGKEKPRQAQEHVMEIYNQFVTGINGDFTMHFMADKQQVEFDNISLDSKAYSYSGSSVMDFTGNGLGDFEAQSMATKSKLQVSPKTVTWKNKKGEEGIFSLDELKVTTDVKKGLSEKQLPAGVAEINIDKLVFKNPGQEKPRGMFAVAAFMQNMEIEKLHLDYAFNDNNLVIKDSEIQSSMLDATIMADITIDAINPQLSAITNGKVVVNKLAPDLEKMVRGLEMQIGKSLPRQDSAIVLELSGKLMKPDIKGFEY